jgi:hypothetical protein
MIDDTDEFLELVDTELKTPPGSLPICHKECIGSLSCRHLPDIQMEVVYVRPGPRRFRDDWGIKQDEDGTITLYKRDLVNPEDLDG